MPAYEVDLWGRIRRANEAARARLLATEDAQRTVRQTLVAQVATAYLELLELDLELEIAQRTYARPHQFPRPDHRARARRRRRRCRTSYQAKILVYSAEATIADIQRRIEQQENALSILLGRNPGTDRARQRLDRADRCAPKFRPVCPRRCWSAVRTFAPPSNSSSPPTPTSARPRPRSFRRSRSTGFYGFQSVALSDLFTGAARTWQFGPARHVAAVHRRTPARQLETGRGAFRGIAGALPADGAGRLPRSVRRPHCLPAHARISRSGRKSARRRNRDATELANVRYEGGVTSYLEVLYNEQELFNAELGLAQARRNELLSVVQLYRALGGGWMQSVRDPRRRRVHDNKVINP